MKPKELIAILETLPAHQDVLIINDRSGFSVGPAEEFFIDFNVDLGLFIIGNSVN